MARGDIDRWSSSVPIGSPLTAIPPTRRAPTRWPSWPPAHGIPFLRSLRTDEFGRPRDPRRVRRSRYEERSADEGLLGVPRCPDRAGGHRSPQSGLRRDPERPHHGPRHRGRRGVRAPSETGLRRRRGALRHALGRAGPTPRPAVRSSPARIPTDGLGRVSARLGRSPRAGPFRRRSSARSWSHRPALRGGHTSLAIWRSASSLRPRWGVATDGDALIASPSNTTARRPSRSS